jgi:membrane protease YdiL (CAAX protease family)
MRAGVRLVTQAAVLLLATLLLRGLLRVLRALGRSLLPQAAARLGALVVSQSPAYWLLFAASMCLCTTLSVWIARRFIDRRSFASLGVVWDGDTGRDLSLGVLVAALIQSALFGVEWAAGWLHVTGFGWSARPIAQVLPRVAAIGLVFAMVAWYEELLARGYWLLNMSEGLNRPLAVLLSSSAFALGHISNPNVTWVAIVALLGPGLLFAWAVIRTGRLWLAIGLHFGWNLFEGLVFGFPVSGLATVTLIQTTVDGPTLWTGGEFGPEAGLVVLPALAAGAFAIGLATRGRAVRSRAAVD